METQRERLGQYEILGSLGAGGMGEVYAARDPVLGRKVAIKVLAVRLSGDRDTLVRFTQEARSASALNHPNIVTIHEVGMDEGAPYIVMECIEGRDLRSMLAGGPLPNRKTLEIASQIADGLAAAHEQGIIHRDLKPENLMYTKDGFVKILDFGLAKVVRSTPSDEEETLELELPGTNPGTILGTVGYMSPEQARGRTLDVRSDQFALGAILYELATGRPAFDRDTAIDTLSAILHDDPDPIGRYNAKIPQPFCWIVDRLLSKEPDERYASTRDLARELRMLRERMATESSDFDLPRPPVFASKRSRVAALGAVVLLVATGAIWMGRDRIRFPPFAKQQSDTAKRYLAVMRFQDLTGDRNGQLVVDGFAETLTARLAHFPSVQVMRPQTHDAAAPTERSQIAKELGANIVLTGSMQRNGDRLRVAYALFDASTQSESRDLVEGSVTDLFGVQDRLAESVAQTMHLGGKQLPIARASIPDDATSQRKYLEALGYLAQDYDMASVDHAISLLEELSSENSASILAALGRAYLVKYQLTHDSVWATRAGTACEKAAEMDPQNPDVHYTLGELRRRTGRHADAVAEYKRALAQQPNDANAVLGLAATYDAQGHLAEAAAEYRHAIQLQPNFWGGYLSLGAFHFAHGQWADAATQFQKVIQLKPDHIRAYNNLGAVYQQLGRYDDAIKVFSDSLRRKPTPQAYSNLGTCYYSIGRYADAATAFEKATQLVPTKYLYWLNLGDARRRLPNAKAGAAEAYNRAIERARADISVDPKNYPAHAALAICLAKTGHGSEAEKEIAITLNADPTNTSYVYQAAIVANARGDQKAAAEHLREAIALGYNAENLQSDPEFADLRKSAIFQQILQQTTAATSK